MRARIRASVYAHFFSSAAHGQRSGATFPRIYVYTCLRKGRLLSYKRRKGLSLVDRLRVGWLGGTQDKKMSRCHPPTQSRISPSVHRILRIYTVPTSSYEKQSAAKRWRPRAYIREKGLFLVYIYEERGFLSCIYIRRKGLALIYLWRIAALEIGYIPRRHLRTRSSRRRRGGGLSHIRIHVSKKRALSHTCTRKKKDSLV